MGKQTTSSSSSKSSISLPSIRRVLLSFFFALAILSITLHLIYLYTEQSQSYSSSARKIKHLSNAFDKNPHQTTISTLQNNQYTIVRTQCSECVTELIDFLGSKDGKVVVNRDYQGLEGLSESMIPLLWRTRMMIKHYVADPEPQAKIWVFWINKQIPKSQIQQIVRLEPQSSIILVTNSKSKIAAKGFKDAGKVDNFDLVKILKSAKIPKKQAQVYINYYNQSVSTLFDKVSPKSIKKFESLTPALSSLSKKTKQVLTKLCKTGSIKSTKLSTKTKQQLQSLGVETVVSSQIGTQSQNKKLQWKQSKYILNYMLQSYEICGWDREFYAKKNRYQQQQEKGEIHLEQAKGDALIQNSNKDSVVEQKNCVCPSPTIKTQESEEQQIEKENDQAQANKNTNTNTNTGKDVIINNDQNEEEQAEREEQQQQKQEQKNNGQDNVTENKQNNSGTEQNQQNQQSQQKQEQKQQKQQSSQQISSEKDKQDEIQTEEIQKQEQEEEEEEQEGNEQKQPQQKQKQNGGQL